MSENTAEAVRIPLKKYDCNVEETINKVEKMIQQVPVTVDCEKNAAYFRKLVTDTRIDLNAKCEEWNKILESEELNESVQGDIRTAIGKAQLVMKERGCQFEGLIDNHEYGTSEKKINSSDLQGFWDMIYAQIEDVNNLFGRLLQQKDNNWVELKEASPIKRKPLKKTKQIKTSGANQQKKNNAAIQKLRRKEARKRFASARAAMQNKNKSTFHAGFFTVESPVKENIPAVCVVESPLITHASKSAARKQAGTPTSCSSGRKHTTPSADNFMHGRVMRSRLASSSHKSSSSSSNTNNNNNEKCEAKKSLNFAQGDPPAPASTNSESVDPREAMLTVVSSPVVALNKQAKPSESAETDHRDRGSEQILTTLQSNHVTVEERFARLDAKLDILVSSQRNAGSAAEPHQDEKQDAKELELLRLQIAQLTVENSSLKDQLAQGTTAAVDDRSDRSESEDEYKRHYERSRAEVIKLEHRLEAYRRIVADLPRVEEGARSNVAMIKQASAKLHEKKQQLVQLEANLNSRNQHNNEELLRLRQAHLESCEKLNDYELVCSQNIDLGKDLENAAHKNQVLQQEMHDLVHRLEAHVLANKQIELQLTEERQLSAQLIADVERLKFEKNELEVELQSVDANRQRLEEIIGHQDTLRDTAASKTKKLDEEMKQARCEREKAEDELARVRSQLAAQTDRSANQRRAIASCDQLLSRDVLQVLDELHLVMINFRKEQSRRSLDFLNSDVSEKEMEQVNGFHLNVPPTATNGADDSSVDEDSLEKKIKQVSSLLGKIVDLQANIQEKNESDCLHLSSEFKAVKKRLDAYEQKDEKERKSGEDIVRLKDQTIQQLSQQLEQTERKYTHTNKQLIALQLKQLKSDEE